MLNSKYSIVQLNTKFIFQIEEHFLKIHCHFVCIQKNCFVCNRNRFITLYRFNALINSNDACFMRAFFFLNENVNHYVAKSLIQWRWRWRDTLAKEFNFSSYLLCQHHTPFSSIAYFFFLWRIDSILPCFQIVLLFVDSTTICSKFMIVTFDCCHRNSDFPIKSNISLFIQSLCLV